MIPDKSTARAAIRARRRAAAVSRTADDAALLAERFAANSIAWLRDALHHDSEDPAALRGAAVACYLSGPLEPPTDRLLALLHEQGATVLLPVCRPEHVMDWVSWRPGVPMHRSPYAPVDEPDAAGLSLSQVLADHGMDAILLPATGIDSNGNRLGQGGGYYDRFLDALTLTGHSCPGAALIFETEFVTPGTFPVEVFDAPMDAVITEERWLRLPR
ncbi:5-formyltetrahydrofolate cyclo-ligase [Arthrobacter sp. NPDC090010]|uniref:5-formyltetrahydrofolate cyclo-ligase n=1 Tax=Arthrobacter sp. NPDC090010 TaxID=3363942 RepID=UPI00382F6B14